MNEKLIAMMRTSYKSIFTDYATGMFNRAYLELVLAPKYAAEPELGCLFVDMDNLRGMNDRYGHVKTNHVLHATAQKLKEVIPDIVRYGGDEFVALLPQCNGQLVNWKAVSEYAVRLEPVPIAGEHVRVTVSIGSTHRKPFESIEETIERANMLMKEEKLKKRGMTSFIQDQTRRIFYSPEKFSETDVKYTRSSMNHDSHA